MPLHPPKTTGLGNLHSDGTHWSFVDDMFWTSGTLPAEWQNTNTNTGSLADSASNFSGGHKQLDSGATINSVCELYMAHRFLRAGLNFSVSFRFLFRESGNMRVRVGVYNRSAATNHAWLTYDTSLATPDKFHVRTDDHAGTGPTDTVLSALADVATSTWYWLTMQVDGDGSDASEVRWYLNTSGNEPTASDLVATHTSSDVLPDGGSDRRMQPYISLENLTGAQKRMVIDSVRVKVITRES